MFVKMYENKLENLFAEKENILKFSDAKKQQSGV